MKKNITVNSHLPLDKKNINKRYAKTVILLIKEKLKENQVKNHV